MTYNGSVKKDHGAIYYVVDFYCWVLDFVSPFCKNKFWEESKKAVHYILQQRIPNNVPFQTFLS